MNDPPSSNQIMKLFQQIAIDNKFLYLFNKKLLYDEFTVNYHQETSIYHLPLTSQSIESSISSSLSSFEVLTLFSNEIIKFLSKFHDSTTNILDIPIHILPSLETSMISNTKDNSIYFCFPHMENEVTLAQHLESGRWVSEKLLLKWTIQILRSLKSAHERFLFLPEFSSQNIQLLSDEVVLSAYRRQVESVRVRKIKEEEEMKLLRKQARQQSSSSYNSITDEMKLPEVPTTRKTLKLSFSTKSRGSILQSSQSITSSTSITSIDSSSVTSKSDVTPSVVEILSPSKLAPRKDAWLRIPFPDISALDLPSYISKMTTLISGKLDQEQLPIIPKPLIRRQTSTESIKSTAADGVIGEYFSISAWLRKYQINKREREITEQSMYQLISITFSSFISETTPPEIANKCRETFSWFVQSVHKDLRSLGSVIIESYLRRPFTLLEKQLVFSPSFSVTDFPTINSFDRMSKGMMRLLQICFTPPGDKVFIESVFSDEDSHRSYTKPKVHILRAQILKYEEEILTLLEKEFDDMGGIEPRLSQKDNLQNETFWTKEVQEIEAQKKQDRLAELERKAKLGTKQAQHRNVSRRKQLLFDMLPEDQQQLILRKKHYRKVAIANKKDRDKFVFKALFHRWGMSRITQWVKDCLLNSLKRNYYLKKSGVKLSLEQKHEWDRTVKPIERAIGKILMTHPYQPPVVKVEGAQALLLQLKERVIDPPVEEKANKKIAKLERPPASQRPQTPLDESSNPSTPSHSRPTTADNKSIAQSQGTELEDEPEENIVELDEMSSHEKEIRYLHCFEYASHTLSTLLINEAGITVSVFEDADLKSSLSVAKFALKAINNATETLEKSAVASNLPPDQFREKMLVTAAKKLGSWDAINIAANSFGEMLMMKDRQWFSQLVSFISFSIVWKYDAEERVRKKGEAIAASRIQGFARGYITRRKIKEIWRLADEQFQREETRRLERERELKEMNKILIKSKHKTPEDEIIKPKVPTDEDATWISVSPHFHNSSNVELFVSFQKNSILPKEENRRGLQIKCVGRILQQPELIPDPECSNYSSRHPDQEPKEGMVEIIIDDIKRILKIRQEWAIASADFVDCVLKWEELADRLKRLSSCDIEDEAAAYLKITGLTPNRKYKFKVMVNMRYRPQLRSNDKTKKSNKIPRGIDDPEEIRLIRAGYISITTGPDVPHSPEFINSDIIHYDHKIPIEKSLHGRVPQHIERTIEEEIESLLDNQGLSVVDKLEKYKDMITSKRGSTAPTNKKTRMKSVESSLIDHHSGLTERRVSCRLTWTIPYSNGNSIVQYQIQKLVENSWENLGITTATNYTDTVPVIDPLTNQPNVSALYRVRASNEYGWSSYSEPYHVILSDKISGMNSSPPCPASTQSSSKISYTSYDIKQMSSLLPHGITLPKKHEISSIKSPSKLLSSQERDMLVYNNMYSLPPSYHHEEVEGGMKEENNQEIMTKEFTETISMKSEKKIISVDYGKNPQRHPDSTLAGETLHDVNKSLEQWLCRLADTCPIDETKLSHTFDEENDVNHHHHHDPLHQIMKNESIDHLKPQTHRAISSFSVLEEIYHSSGHTDKQLPIPFGSSSNKKKSNDNLIQQLVISNHKTKVIKPATQSLGTKSLPNGIFLPK